MIRRITSTSLSLAKNIHSSALRYAVVTEVVPALGESITEGSIQQWTKAVGEHVAVDDVVVIVETDKVTVDIKSTNAGVLTAQLGEDEVTVGQPLFEIDTEGEATVTSASPMAAESAAPPVPATPAAPPAVAHVGRIPSIKFLGKRSLIKDVPAVSKPFPPAQTLTNAKKFLQEGDGVDFRTLEGRALYGRPVISEREAEMILSGGADDF